MLDAERPDEVRPIVVPYTDEEVIHHDDVDMTHSAATLTHSQESEQVPDHVLLFICLLFSAYV